jgi:type IV pilus assembly protein PilF
MNSKLFKVVLPSILLSVILSGCVTTMDRPTQSADSNKASETHVSAGFAYLRKGDKGAARRHFQTALDGNANSAGAHNGLGLVNQQERDEVAAEKHFKRALQIDPTLSQARFNYSGFLYRHERYADAHKQLLILAGDVTYSRRDTATLNLGLVQKQLGDTSSALDSFHKVVGLNFRLAQAHLEIADLYFSQKEYASAGSYLEHYNKTRQGRPSAKSLWLKIRLERIFGNKDKEASAAVALKSMHPYSKEYLEYKKTVSP